jgi:uncharacterized RDD family membrane protein YckC
MIQTQSHRGEYAGFVTRAVALVIDLVIISGGILFGNGIITLIAEFLQMEGAFVIEVARFIGLQFVFPFAYFVGLTGLFDQTIGKVLMGLRVIKADGSHMDLRTATWRFLLNIIGVGPVFLGYLWVLVDNRRRAWHDILAGTYVIYEEDRITHKS